MRERTVLQIAAGDAAEAGAREAADFGGVACEASQVPQLLPLLIGAGAPLRAVSAAIDLRDDASASAVIDAMQRLYGQGISPLWLLRLTSSDRYDRPSAPRAMPAAAAAVTRIAQAARPLDVQIALEPSPGAWLHEPEDAVRAAMHINRRHVGVAASLASFAGDDPATLTQRLRLVTPKLLAIRVASRDVLVPGRAADDEARVWRQLVAMGYAGLVLIKKLA